MVIEFNILHSTEKTRELNKLDIDYPLSDCDVRPITFYHINAIGTHFDRNDNDKEYVEIHTNGNEFIVADLDYLEVKRKLSIF
jgi:hypothetical protein